MVVVGIDPGYALIGYGVIEVDEKGKMKALDYGVIKTLKDDNMDKRLLDVENGLIVLFNKYNPDAVAVEELFFTSNQKTAIKVAQARGVILLTATKFCGRVYEYTPLQIKQAITGYGRADKMQMQIMTKTLLNLKEIPKPDDAADALAAAICHGQTNRFTKYFEVKS